MDQDIVETFLLEQLEKEIKNANGKALTNCKLCPAAKEFTNLKELIEEKASKTGAALKHTRREKLYELLNVMAEWLQLSNKQNFLNLTREEAKYLCGLQARLTKIDKDLKEPIKGESERGDNQEFPSDLEIYWWSSHAVDLEKIHGFHDERMIMERLLLKKGSKVIGIVGVAGVGKTTLSRVAFNNEKVKEKFPLRIWLCLSRQQVFGEADLEELFVKRMLSCLGFEGEVIESLGRRGLEKLQLALQHELKRGEHLIVLDDVWKIEEGEKKEGDHEKNEEGDEKKADEKKMGEAVKKLFSFLTEDRGEHGGTLIVTSRFGKLEENAKNMHRLKLLRLADNDSCWEIFSDAVGEVGIVDQELFKREILEKCDGLPLMAKMLGEIAHPMTPVNSAGKTD